MTLAKRLNLAVYYYPDLLYHANAIIIESKKPAIVPRQSTVKSTNQIVVLENGEVVKTGNQEHPQ
jgi:hypothetical protein